jgi:hypothetical protein
LPVLAIFHEVHKDKDAVVLGVNSERIATQDLMAFIDEEMIDYPIFPMPPAPFTPFGKLTGLPTTYFISPDGKQLKEHVGPLNKKQLEGYLKAFTPN